MAQKYPVDSEWFFARLRDKGYSLRRFAGEMGMDASAASRMLNGQRNMTAEEQDRVAALLGLPIREIAVHRKPVPLGMSEMAQAGYEATGKGGITAPGEVPNDKKNPYRHPIFGCMKDTMTIMPGVDLTKSLVTDDDFDWGVYENE